MGIRRRLFIRLRKMIVYVTVFDKDYLVRGIALARSFARHCAGDLLFLGCIDSVSTEFLGKIELPGTRILDPETFIFGDLLALKEKRSTAEFCWTTKPFLLAHALEVYPEAEWVVYLDADSLIFSSITRVLRKSGELTCVFTPHNFFREFKHYEANVGRYNAGFVAFRNSDSGRQALTSWRNLCVGSVSANPSGNEYGDQKYLDELAERWRMEPDAVNKGLNVAPWNVGKYRFSVMDGQVFVDDDKLCFFHFQGFMHATRHMVLMYRGVYSLPGAVRRLVYRPYLAELRNARRLVAECGGKKLLTVPGVLKSIRSLWAARKNIALTW